MEDEILKFYHEFNDESERLESNPSRVEYITTMTYLNKVIPKNSIILDLSRFKLKQLYNLSSDGPLF